jgi:GNAT superfamily N-acetyltransferase
LKRPSQKGLELNEVRWWSKWAQVNWFGSKGYLLTSQDFREPFFNRAGTFACEGVSETAAWAEKELTSRGMSSTFLAFDSCARAARALEDSGYKPFDTMTVLISNGRVGGEGAAQAKIIASPSAESWTRAYLAAFYGGQDLAACVTDTVRTLLKARAATLLEARFHDETAGVLAIFRTRGLAGVYCLGTVPEHRRKGVAETLLQRAKEIADEEGRKLILQSLSSEGSEGYYTKRGFVPLYSKRMLRKQNSNAIERKPT